MRYLLTYWVWTELMLSPQSVNRGFVTIDALRAFAKANGVHRGSVFEIARNTRGVATLRFVSGV